MGAPEHTFLVAVTVVGLHHREQAQAALMARLSRATVRNDPVGIGSWWIAEDDRADRSDNDSAVFVKPGAQAEAHQLLLEHFLAEPWNEPAADGWHPSPTH